MKKSHGRILYHWLPLLAYCAFILIMSSIHTPKIMPRVTYSDKILHFGAFVVMAVLCWRAFGSLQADFRRGLLVLLTLLASSAFGILIEVNQSFIPYRSAELMDFWADVAGTLMGILISLWYAGRKQGTARQATFSP